MSCFFVDIQNTKLQIIEILQNTATSSREHRILMRMVLDGTTEWFDDDVEEEVKIRTKSDGYGEQLPVRVSEYKSYL